MKVWPTNEENRKVLAHPTGRAKFPDEGPADWPDDVYTHKQIRDGSLTIEDPGAGAQRGAQQGAVKEEKPSAEPPKQEPAPTQKAKDETKAEAKK